MNDRKQYIIQPLPGYAPEIGRWLWALEDCRRRTREALQGMNPAHIDWTAKSDGHSIGTLMYHIAAIEVDWLYTEVLMQDWSDELVAMFPYPVRDEQGRLTRVMGISLDDHWRRMNRMREILLDAFKGMTLEDFYRPRSMAQYDVTPEWVLHHLCQHEALHRDEIAALREGAEKANG